METMAKKKQLAVSNISARVFAVFVAQALGMLGAGSLIGIEVWQAALLAGVMGVATVAEGLARAFLHDGKLSLDEINDVFGKVHAPTSAPGRLKGE
jgi:hypothetical protein